MQIKDNRTIPQIYYRPFTSGSKSLQNKSTIGNALLERFAKPSRESVLAVFLTRKATSATEYAMDADFAISLRMHPNVSLLKARWNMSAAAERETVFFPLTH